MIKDCVDKSSVDQWATGYNLRNKLRCAPGMVSRLKSPEVNRPQTPTLSRC